MKYSFFVGRIAKRRNNYQPLYFVSDSQKFLGISITKKWLFLDLDLKGKW